MSQQWLLQRRVVSTKRMQKEGKGRRGLVRGRAGKAKEKEQAGLN